MARAPRKASAEQPAIETSQDDQADALRRRLQTIIGRLEAEATARIAKRTSVEKRWIEDLEQYYGLYDEDTRKQLKKGEKSQLNINLTRPKTDAMSARLMDLLFPTDDKNWGIRPTPVPELKEQAREAVRQVHQLMEQAKQAAEQQQPGAAELQQQADQAKQAAHMLEMQVAEGRKRADLMAAEIDDQLKESHYHAAMRDLLEDGCKLGTGVCKGPVTGDRVRKGWKKKQVQGSDGKTVEVDEYELKMSAGDQPAMRYVDIWSFFPDLDARTIEEGQGTLERHLMNEKKLRALARLPGFDKGVIRELLRQKPRMPAPSYLADLRNLGAENQHITNDLYHVWEYSGPLAAEDMRDLALAMGDVDMLDDLGEVDPLAELNAIIWFCQGELLKFSIYPFDSGECMYSVFNLAKDESSVFGYGIPWIMRDPAAALNAGWRAMMDNAGLSVGPQIVIARDQIEPADGDWTLKPRKVWWAKGAIPQDKRTFATFDIPMHQAEIANIIAISQKFIDDMTAMPSMAEGELGNVPKQTPVGTTVLMLNANNVVFRRIVKNFDDDVTTPNIRRFYDWNMQFNPKEEIKGDYDVDARGSSVLLVREMQAQNLFLIAMHLGTHPVYGPMLKNRDVLRKMFQAHMIPSDEVVLTDDEIDGVLAAAAAEQGAQDIETQKLEMQAALTEMEWANRKEIALIERETQLLKMAETMNMSLDKLEAMFADRREDRAVKREERASKERIFAAEAAIEQRNAEAARAAGEQPQGSGGYISAGA